MTLKGSKKALRNIIACIIAVIIIGGITSIVYSNSTASIKISYGEDKTVETWDTTKVFDKNWATNKANGEINFIVDLSDYYKSISTAEVGNIEEPFTILSSVIDQNLGNSVVLDTKIEQITDDNGFKGEYKVTIKLLEQAEDYSINIGLLVEEGNSWNIASVQKNFNIVRDMTKPIVSIKGISDGETISKADVTITSNEENSTIEVEVKKLISNKTSKDSYINEKTITFDKDEDYELTATAIDKAGNTSNSITIPFTINTGAPTVGINGIEVEEDGEGLASIFNSTNLNLKISDKSKIDFNESVYEITNEIGVVESGNFTLGENDENGEAKIILPEAGVYNLYIKAVDQRGRAAEINRKIIIDTVDPEVKIFLDDTEKTDAELNQSGVHEYQSKTVKIETYDLNQNENKIEITINGKKYDVDGFTTDGRTRTFEHNFTEEGNYTVTATSTDLSGRVTARTFSFIIDTTKPLITIGEIKADNSVSKDVTVNVIEENFKYNTVTVEYTKKIPTIDAYNEIETHKLDFNADAKDFTQTYPAVEFKDDAEYVIKVTAIDKAGNEAEIKHATFTTDNVNPIMKIYVDGTEKTDTDLNQSGVNEYQDKEIKIETYDVNQKENIIEITRNGGEYNVDGFTTDGRTRTFEHTFPEGNYTVTATSTDLSGRVTPRTFSFIIDKTPPGATITGIEDKKHYNTDTTVEVSVVDVNHDINRITITRDGKEYLTSEDFSISGDTAYFSKTISKDEEGIYVVEVYSKDVVGHEHESTVTKTFTIDKTPPVATITGIEDKKHYNTDTTVEVSVVDINHDINRITIKKDGKEYFTSEDFSISGDTASFSKTISKDEEGVYVVEVYSKDVVGHELESPVTKTFTIDKTPPVATITGIEDGDHYNTDKTVEVSIVDINHDVNRITITKDGEEYFTSEEFSISGDTDVKTASFSKTISKDEEGIYVVEVYSKDVVGNELESTVTKTFTIDSTKPVATITGIEDKKHYNTDTTVEVSVVDVNHDINRITITKDGKEYFTSEDFSISGDTNVKTASFSKTISKDEEGLYVVEVYSKDKADNELESTVTKTFTIDKTPPVAIITGIEDKEHYNTEKTVEVSVVDVNHDINRITITRDGKEYLTSEDFSISGDTASFSKTISKDEEGLYVVEVYSKDVVGHELETPVTKTFTIDKTPPVATITGIEDEEHYNTEKTVEVSVVDVNHDINKIIITKDGKEYFTSEDFSISGDTNVKTASFSKTISKDEEGVYVVEVYSKDVVGHELETPVTKTFTIDKTPPVITIGEIEAYNSTSKDVSVNVIEENFKYNTVTVEYTKKIPTIDAYKEIETHKLEFKAEAKDFTQVYPADEFKDDAEYVVKVTATDKAGNEAEIKYATFTTDNVDPGMKIFLGDNTEKTDAELNKSGVHEYQSKKIKIETYDVNQKENIIKVTRNGEEYKVNGFTTDGRTRTFEHNFTEEGNYTVTATSTDLSGRITTRSFSFIIDTTKPVITIENFDELNNSFNNPGKSLKVIVDELNYTYNKVNVEVKKILEDTTVVPVSLNFANKGTTSVNEYSVFGDDARYEVTLSATDLAGNKADEKHLYFVMTTDTTKPVATITGIENGEHYNENKTVTVSVVDVNHNINRVTITKDGKQYFTSEQFSISGDTNVKTASLSQIISEEGEYVVTVYSKDKAGNELGAVVTKTFTIDKTKPVITPMLGGENREIKDGEYIDKIFTPYFKLDESEDTITEVILNNGSNIAGAIPMASTEMVYNYKVTATDKAGNIATKAISFTVDVTNPEVKVTGILDGFFSKNMKPEYSITDKNLDKDKTSALMNGKPFESGTVLSEQDYYNFKLVGTDLASNVTARNIIFAIDKDKPVIRFVEAMSGKYFTEDFIPNFVIEDLTDYTIVSMTLDGEDYELGDMIEEEGKHVLYIEVKDKAENIESISIEFILDKTPPKFIVNGIKDKGIYFDAVNAEITLENPLDKITGVTVNGELSTGDIKEENGQQVVKLNFNEVKEYEIVLNATDEAGNKTEEVINFEIANKSIFTILFKNKATAYPALAAILALGGLVAVKAVKRDKNTNNDSNEESEE